MNMKPKNRNELLLPQEGVVEVILPACLYRASGEHLKEKEVLRSQYSLCVSQESLKAPLTFLNAALSGIFAINAEHNFF